jgi:hypothetical protein
MKIMPEAQNIITFLKSRKFLKLSIGILAGSIAGFIYFRFVGCNTGVCPITSHSYSTIAIGGLLGYLIVS